MLRHNMYSIHVIVLLLLITALMSELQSEPSPVVLATVLVANHHAHITDSCLMVSDLCLYSHSYKQ